jgi:DNA-binding HxlR family transcriptional regulator
MPRAPAPKDRRGAAPEAPRSPQTPRGGGEPARVGATALDPCCPHYHRAVELLGRRWAGAIVEVLLRADAHATATAPLRFGEIAQAVPEISDRLLARRLKELEERGVVQRTTTDHQPRYALTEMGRELEPAVAALTAWGRRWLDTSASSFRPA